jgi:hypothetical protein
LPAGAWQVELESSAPRLAPAPVAGLRVTLPAQSVMLLVAETADGAASPA